VYYLEDKNKKALQSVIEKKGSKVINYYELANMSHVFNISLSKKEKHSLLGKKQGKSSCKKSSSKGDYSPKNDGFLGRILHSDVLPFSSSESRSRTSNFV